MAIALAAVRLKATGVVSPEGRAIVLLRGSFLVVDTLVGVRLSGGPQNTGSARFVGWSGRVPLR